MKPKNIYFDILEGNFRIIGRKLVFGDFAHGYVDKVAYLS